MADPEQRDSDMEQEIFRIITGAGEARGLLYDALGACRRGDEDGCSRCWNAANEKLRSAHEVQTDLITRDLNGSLPVSLLLVHAQDQLMTTMTEQSLIEELMTLTRQVRDLHAAPQQELE